MMQYHSWIASEVLTAVVVKSSNFWDIALCSSLKVNQCFRGTCYLSLQSQRISQARNQCEAGSKQSNRLAKISVYIGTRMQMQDNKSVPADSPIGQNEPIRVLEQLTHPHLQSHIIEWNNGRWDQENQCGPGKGCICTGLEKMGK
jgi:hypothetical protein